MAITRHPESVILDHLKHKRSVLLIGPRHCGEKELLSRLNQRAKFLHIDLSKGPLLPSEKDLQSLSGLVCLNNVHAQPHILFAVLEYIETLHHESFRPDRSLKHVQFLMIAHQDLRLHHQWRRFNNTEVIPYSTLSLSELCGMPKVDLFSRINSYSSPSLSFPPESSWPAPELFIQHMLRGGYPPAITAPSWRDHSSIIQKILADLYHNNVQSHIPELSEHIYFESLRQIAKICGDLINDDELTAKITLEPKIIDPLISLLEEQFILKRVRPWLENYDQADIKSSGVYSIYFYDVGLMSYLLSTDPLSATPNHITPEDLQNDEHLRNTIYKTFVFSELTKIAASQKGNYDIALVDPHTSPRIDFIFSRLEYNGVFEICPLIIAPDADMKEEYSKALGTFKEWYGEDVLVAMVLYHGDKIRAFYDFDYMIALPLHQLEHIDVSDFELTSWYTRYVENSHLIAHPDAQKHPVILKYHHKEPTTD